MDWASPGPGIQVELLLNPPQQNMRQKADFTGKGTEAQQDSLTWPMKRSSTAGHDWGEGSREALTPYLILCLPATCQTSLRLHLILVTSES